MSKIIYNTERFVNRSKIVHNNKYDYSKSVYIRSIYKVEIICKIHGSFHQTPSGHLRGRGCDKCNRRSNTSDFIKKAIKIHNNKYDYSKVDYVTISDKVEIICKIHGSFHQTPSGHLAKNGCLKCRNRSNNKEFIEKSNKIHGDLYDYSKVEYIGTHDKVEIICKIHGSFHQTPHGHYITYGCRKCSNEERSYNQVTNKNKNNSCHLYWINLSSINETFNKIGISKDIKSRFYSLNKIYDINIENLVVSTREDCFKLEQFILRKMKKRQRLYKPLLAFCGASECYI